MHKLLVHEDHTIAFNRLFLLQFQRVVITKVCFVNTVVHQKICENY